MVKMLIKSQLKYPNLTSWAKNDLPDVYKNERVWTAFKKHGQFNSFTAFQAISWVEGTPLLKIRLLGGANGAFDPEKPNGISVAKEIVDRFEVDFIFDRARLLVESTVLHELVHWGDNLDGRDQSGEEGKAFEHEAYRHDIERYWRSPTTSTNVHEADLDGVGPHHPRGIRNNNPGNIRIGDDWKGLAKADEMTTWQAKEQDFCVFSDPKYGISRNVQNSHQLPGRA